MNDTSSSKSLTRSVHLMLKASGRHWVGDGFYVCTLFDPKPELYALSNPFIMLDYGAPRKFEPAQPPGYQPRGVGEHPHRGFETVTIALQGEIAHRDSGGGGGVIKAGGVQWMTAGSGLVHEELFSEEFNREGGTLEMVQLWVNLPRALKMTTPAYQGIEAGDIPVVSLGEGCKGRLIAGAFEAEEGSPAGSNPKNESPKGPCHTHTEMRLALIDLNPGSRCEISIPAQHNAMCLVLRGNPEIAGDRCEPEDMVFLSRPGSLLELAGSGQAESRILLLNGMPIDEPIAAYGPFVMNDHDEIRQAIADYQSGAMGTLQPG